MKSSKRESSRMKLAAAATMPAKCPENEDILNFLRDRQRELCGEWNGALTRAFQQAIISFAEQAEPVRTLQEASKVKLIGPGMINQLRPLFASRPPVPSRPKVDRGRASGSAATVQAVADHQSPEDHGDAGAVTPINSTPPVTVHKFVGYVPKKGSAAYAMVVTMLMEKMRGKEFMLKDDLMSAAERCRLAGAQMRSNAAPEKPELSPGGKVGRMFYSGWSSMETLQKNDLVRKEGCPARYSLTPQGYAVALECMRRGRISLPTPEELQQEAATRQDQTPGAAGGRFESASGVPERPEEAEGPLGLQAIDPSAGPTSIVDRAGFESMRLPPLRPGETFAAAYDIILLIDSREGGARQGQNLNSVNSTTEILYRDHHILVEIKTLPVGDALWIARHKASSEDFVLDFILERKTGNDLWASIKSKRFKDQKLRLQRCGLRKLIYLVEGSLDIMNGADSVRTAALQTEIEDGFDVQRTLSLTDTRRRYADLTRAISQRYSEAWDAFAAASATGESAAVFGGQERCMSYSEFLHVCKHIMADTVGDLFAHMLLQINSVTVDVAMAVMQRYPTLRALVEAYRSLEGDHEAQSCLLSGLVVKNKPIPHHISRKVFEFVWT